MLDSPRSNTLDAAIVATVAATHDRRLTVTEIAACVGASASDTARCIALHRYFRLHPDMSGSAGAMSFPAPADFIVPQPDDVIDHVALGMPAT